MRISRDLSPLVHDLVWPSIQDVKIKGELAKPEFRADKVRVRHKLPEPFGDVVEVVELLGEFWARDLQRNKLFQVTKKGAETLRAQLRGDRGSFENVLRFYEGIL